MSRWLGEAFGIKQPGAKNTVPTKVIMTILITNTYKKCTLCLALFLYAWNIWFNTSINIVIAQMRKLRHKRMSTLPKIPQLLRSWTGYVPSNLVSESCPSLFHHTASPKCIFPIRNTGKITWGKNGRAKISQIEWLIQFNMEA